MEEKEWVKPYREKNDKYKISIVCYEYMKLGHFKSECLDLAKQEKVNQTKEQESIDKHMGRAEQHIIQ